MALVLLLFGVGTFAACAGSPIAPSDAGNGSASGNVPGPSPPGFPTLTTSSLDRSSPTAPWVNFVERPITFSWAPVAGAAWYQVEVGTNPGLADVFSASTRSLSLTTTFTSASVIYPRVIAYTGRAGGHASSARASLILLSFQDFVEALLLGTGPLAESPQSGCPAGPGRMAGWPTGTQVTVTMAASLNAEQQKRLTVAVGQAADATAGAIGARTRGSSDPHPLPGLSEIVAHQIDPGAPFPCSASAQGCTVPQFVSPGRLSQAVISMRGSSNLLGHETGHALYGLCHLAASAGFVSAMGGFDDAGKGLSEADIAALRAVYQAGLRGGSVRGDFVATGLIRP